MQQARAKDWLIGALGMLLVLAAGAAVFWWVVTEPVGDDETSAPPPSVDPGGALAVRPPDDLVEDEVWLADLALNAGTVVTADSRLRDVRAVGRGVVTGADGLLAARVTVDATVPFDVVADELGGDTVVRPADGRQAMVIRTVEALGRELQVVATGTVAVDSGRVVVEPRSIDVGAPDFVSDAIADVVRALVTIEHEIQGLPQGLVLQDVDVRSDGFRAHLQGQDVRLVP